MDIRFRQARNSSGFTLIELMVTLAVMGILAAIAYPSLTTTLANNRVKNQGQNIHDILAFARSEAITRGDTVTITPSNSWQGDTSISVSGTTIKTLPAFNSDTVINSANALSFNSMGLFTGANISVSHTKASVQSVLTIEAGGAFALSKNSCTTPCVTESN
ncbi:type II secretion system protein GspH [Endozoicomonas sp. OPT23]|uniref:GspH/FimT family pseudopilin n=1 Tax=Endozoicomonas sp. OPT23 TaxID=2072845 RepID=UPI00129AD846|nr:GspH/FimT family pseudopilin [Endozoicomonas sp. OPT23]MRI32306.1 type II secretion system protein GspH [Endozoicomonas sp. OPT23]